MSQQQPTFSDAYAAELVTKAVNPLYGDQGTPHYITGCWYVPQGYSSVGSTVTATINRCYYVPFSVWESHSFQGASTINQGTGDSGAFIRLMVFNDNGAIGGPGTLAKDFGQITLGGTAATQTLLSAWAAAPGRYWSAVWHSTAASMYGAEPYTIDSAVGSSGGVNPSHFMGGLSFAGNAGTTTHCHYVDTAYGAAPATAVAPTASLIGNPATTGTTKPPIFALKA